MSLKHETIFTLEATPVKFGAGASGDAGWELRRLGARRVMLVTDPGVAALGVPARIQRLIESEGIEVVVFADSRVEPTIDSLQRAAEFAVEHGVDGFVSVGGGSSIDTAKIANLIATHPAPVMDYVNPPVGEGRQPPSPLMPHLAIPTTAGTGSEVSPAAVITMGRTKATLVDYSLMPDMAIVDPTLTLSMPPAVTADTGIDALTHALEAVVSIFASPYTDAFCVQAARLIFDNLPRAYADGDDLEARTAMANAAAIAGLAFSNAFVGVNHALAHAVGARFGIPHGRANAIFLPHVMRYNAALPTKFMPAPGYSAYVAPDKYAQLGWILFGGRSDDERRERLLEHVDGLLQAVDMPRSLKDAGVDETEFLTALPELARTAFADPSIRTNPRMPLLAEVVNLLRAGYRGAAPTTAATVASAPKRPRR